MSKTVFITGATSGIGEACARVFASGGNRLIISGRRRDRLSALSRELLQSDQCQVLPLELDVRNRDLVHQAIESLPEEWKNIHLLINNAGLALGLSPLSEGDQDQWDQMIDTNIKGLLYISRAVIPLMKKQLSGHIINIGSIAGRETYPNGNVYCATKHAVDALSKGMRMDLLPLGIRVSQVSPGAVETEFSMVRFGGDSERAKNVYRGFRPLTAEDVARVVHYVAGLPEHMNIDDVLLMPSAQASATIIRRSE